MLTFFGKRISGVLLRTLCASIVLAAFTLAQAGTVTFTSSGTWTAPANVTSVTVEVWGGGGAGGGQNLTSDGGGGGGGGAYSRSVITVVPATVYTVSVGGGGLGVTSGTGGTGGDSFFINAATVMAKGGAGGVPSAGTPPAGGLGGAAASGVGTTKFSGGRGGRGRDSNTGRGGPGGSSAGTAANGTAGPDPYSTTTGVTAQAPPAGGGIGGDGGDTGVNGFAPVSGNGGGGGGSGEGLVRTGGSGSGGAVTLNFVGLPTVASAAATAVAASGATLNGSVTSDSNASTTVTFDYGPTVAYGSTITATQSPVAAGVTSAVSVSLAGLSCTTTYHFRAKGVNTNGTVNGADFSFTTLACSAPTVTTTAATALTVDGATLNGTANGNGASTTVSFEYGLTVAYGTNVTASPSPVSASDPTTNISAVLTGLLCGRTYNYRAIGVNSFGTTNGGNLTFTTSACPTLIEFNSTGGTTSTDGLHFYIHDTTKIQVRRLDNTGQVYLRTTIPPNNSLDNGVFLRADGVTYGPSHTVGGGFTPTTPTAYSNFSITPASPANPSSNGVQQTATGTFGVTAGPQVSVLWKYTTPLDFLIAEVTLTIPAGYTVSAANPVRYYHVFDTFLGGSDDGCGFSLVNGGLRTVGTYQPTSGICDSTTSLPSGINVVESFRERSGVAFSNYCASGWQSFFTTGSTNCSVTQAAVMSNALTVPYIDTGIGIELDFTTPGTYTFSYDFVIGSPNVPPYDHLEIQHDGSGTLCPENVTVLACTSTTLPCPAANIVNTGTLTGTLTTTPGSPVITQTPSGGISLGGAPLSSTQTIALSSAGAGTVTLGTSGLSTTPTNGTKCWNTTTLSQSCSLAFVNTPCVSGYECQETGTTYNNPPTALNRNPLYTKLSGTPFTFDVVALQSSGAVASSYTATGNVTVELFDDSASPAPACNAYTGAIASNAITFAAGDNGRKLSAAFNLPNAYGKLRCRVTDTNLTPTVYGCSSDDFAARPQQFSIASSNANADGTGASGIATPLIKAGAAFALTANTSTVGYGGTPTLVPANRAAHTGAVQAGTVAGTFGAASAATGNGATGAGFTYSEVGYVRLTADGVVDSTFTAIDSAVADCVVGSTSNTAASGKYGCNIGSAVSNYFGRFTPDHFTTVVTQGCGTLPNAFTYSAQPFTVVTNALNSGGTATQNYHGATWAKAVTLSNAGSATNMTPGNTLAATDFTNGIGTANGVTYTFPPPATTAPLALTLRALDTDAVTSATFAEGTTTIRSGRLQLQNAYGSELLGLPIPLAIQFWNNGWQQNTLDTCTTIAADQFAWTFPPGTAARPNNLAACESIATVTGSAPNYTVRLTAPGATNAGWANLTLNLNAAAGSTCTTTVGAGYTGLAATANTPWLQHNWTSVVVGDPISRATFGAYRSPLIYRRENY